MTSFESDHDEFEIVFEPEESIPFYAERVLKPLELEIHGDTYIFTRENCWVAFYRDHPEYNHVHLTLEDGNGLFFWEMPDLAEWLAGYKWDEYSPERVRTKKRESMKDLCGWEAHVLLCDEPSMEVKNLYELTQMGDLYTLAGEVTVEKIVEVEDEDDGA